MAKTFVKKGDIVQVTTGKDNGRTGKVLRVYPKTGRVLVEGINVLKKHVRPNSQKNIQGGIVDRECPVHQSNVKVVSRD